MKKFLFLIVLVSILFVQSANAGVTNKTFADKGRAKTDTFFVYTPTAETLFISHGDSGWVIDGGSDSGIVQVAYVMIGDTSNDFGFRFRYNGGTAQWSDDTGNTWNDMGTGTGTGGLDSAEIMTVVYDSTDYLDTTHVLELVDDSALKFTTETDSTTWSVFAPVAPNTGIKLSGSVIVGDPGLTEADSIHIYGRMYFDPLHPIDSATWDSMVHLTDRYAPGSGTTDGQNADSIQNTPVSANRPADGAIFVAAISGDTTLVPVVLSGDATMANTGAVTVADESHAHTTTTISGLDAGNDISAGTLSTDRYSAYGDLGAESKIGTGSTQVAAGDHAHAAAYAPITPDSTEIDSGNVREWVEDKIGQMFARGTQTNMTVTYGDSTTSPGSLNLNVTGGGSGDIEGVTAGTMITGGGTSGTVTINADTGTTGNDGLATKDFVRDSGGTGGGESLWDSVGASQASIVHMNGADTVIEIRDSGVYTIVRPGSNTTFIFGDSGQTHITDLKLGINDGTDKSWTIPNVKGTASQLRRMDDGGTAIEEWFTPTWLTAVPDSFLGSGEAAAAYEPADANILKESEIDASSELLAIMDDETGTGAGALVVFSIAPTFTGQVTADSIDAAELKCDSFRIGSAQYLPADFTNWNTAYGWGNHATQNYLDEDAANVDTQHYRIAYDSSQHDFLRSSEKAADATKSDSAYKAGRDGDGNVIATSYFALSDFDNTTIDSTAAGKLEVKAAGLDSTHIADGKLAEGDLLIDGAPTDEYALTWEASSGTGGQMKWEAQAGMVNPIFQGGGTFYGDIGLGNHRNALNIERVYCAPPEHYIGDTAATHFPGADSILPSRYCYIDDTNFIKAGKLYPDSIPPLWGGGPCDSVRVVTNSCSATDFLTVKDSSFLLHVSVVAYPNGWPHLTDSDIVYWDHKKRGFDSATICWDGACDSTRKIWITPRKVYMAGTPYNAVPECDALPNELSNVFASNDGINFTNRLGTGVGDTIRNPINFATDYIMDSVFYYCQYHGADSSWQMYDQRTCSTSAYRSYGTKLGGTAKADPDIFAAADGTLWLVDVVSFNGVMKVGSLGPEVPFFDILYASHSTNGLDWSEVYKITHATPFLTPCIILDTGSTYKLWTVASNKRTWGYDSYSGGAMWGMFMSTAPRPDTYFTQVGQCTFDIPFKTSGCDSIRPFHIDVVKRGLDEYILIAIGAGGDAGSDFGCAGSQDDVYYIWIAQSFDGLRWHPGNGGYPIYASKYADAWHGQRTGKWDEKIYRASGYWLDDGQTVLRMYYTGWIAGSETRGPHISYMDVRFDGNDSCLMVPLWDIPGNPANDDSKLSFDQRLAGVRYLAIDSAIANSADDTVGFYGMAPFDFKSDSLILYYKTSSATAADIKLDSFWAMVPKYGNPYADSSKAGVNLDLAATSLTRVSQPFSFKFHAGAEAGVCIVVKWGSDDISKTAHFAYVGLKGRKI